MHPLFYIIFGMALATGLMMLRRRFAAFHGQSPDDYEDGFPVFDLEKQLSGQMVCEGAIFGPLGRVTSTFTAEFYIKWDGPHGVMDEVFHYNDGSTQNRQWRSTLDRDGTFVTEADDVPGGAVGVQSGGTAQMRYKIQVPQSAGGHVLDTVDWMYLTPGGVVVNRSQFRKYGFKVAELVATIRPKETT
jgi:hypothetical protein